MQFTAGLPYPAVWVLSRETRDYDGHPKWIEDTDRAYTTKELAQAECDRRNTAVYKPEYPWEPQDIALITGSDEGA